MLAPLEVSPELTEADDEFKSDPDIKLRENFEPSTRPKLGSAPVRFETESLDNKSTSDQIRSRSLDNEDEFRTTRSMGSSTPRKEMDDYHLSPPLDAGLKMLSVSGYLENGAASDDMDSIMTHSIGSTNGSISASMNNVLYDDIMDQPSSSTTTLGSHELLIKVDRPEKILATMDTYVTYRVVTKTRRSDFLESEYEVRRRYSDFAWLRRRLEVDHPMSLIPPLPEKHSVYSLDRFDPMFIRVRCYLLHLFIQTLASIPKVNRHSDLRMFLTAHLQDWVAYRKHEGSGQKMTDALYQFAASRLLSATDSEFNAYTETCQELSQTASAMEKMSSKWHRDEVQSSQDLASVQTVADHWSNNEQRARLRTAVSGVSAALSVNNTALQELCDRFEVDFALPHKHWALYSDATKIVLRRRDAIQWEQCNARDALTRKQSEKDTLSKMVTSNPKLEPKLTKINQQLDELKHKSLKYDTELRDANIELRRELQRWNAMKESDLVNTMRTFSKQRVEYHKRCLEAWERASATMGDQRDSNDDS